MTDSHLQNMRQRLQTCLETGRWETTGDSQQVDTERYLSPEHWRREQASLFRDYPLIVARADDLEAENQWLAVDIAGTSLLLTRTENGEVQAYLNACRHRGMQLLPGGESLCKKRLVCPYHGWTYRHDGALHSLPHETAFPDLNKTEHGLVRLPCAVHQGFVWVRPRPGTEALDIASWLGGLDDDFSYFDLAGHLTFAEGRSRVQANWKLCIDAFLEAYHVRVLHRQTVAPFFEDALAVSDTDGRHFRSAVARKALRDEPGAPLREQISYTHFVFPNHIFVFHPDYVSQLSIVPRDETEFDWCHRMLIPAAQNTEALRPHWQKSFELIEGGVFQREDLRAAEQIQRGLLSGANEHISLGQLETLIVEFHRLCDEALATSAG